MKLLLLFFIVAAQLAFGAGTVTQSVTRLGSSGQRLITLSWTGDASGGSVPSTVITATSSPSQYTGFYIQQVETDPGSTAPTDNYDIVINNAGGLDVMGGNCANRDTSTTEVCYPQNLSAPIRGELTFVLTNSSVNSATGTVILLISPIPGPGARAATVGSVTGTANEITVTGTTTPVLSLASTMDLSGKTVRVPSSTTLPATCAVGDAYMDTNATTGRRWYLCESTDTWALQGDGAVNPSTSTNCSSAAAPAVCGAAAAGSVVVAAAATEVVVNTTAVTANSQILAMYDAGLGTKLSVTCNTTIPALYGVTARTAGTSFTLSATAPMTNPACFSYLIVN